MEKTSHRIGRIIHEKDVPKEGVVNLVGTPPNLAASYMDDDEFEIEPPPAQAEEKPDMSIVSKSEQEQYAEDQLKSPSKVVLLSVGIIIMQTKTKVLGIMSIYKIAICINFFRIWWDLETWMTI